jgi:hypothetical protein
MARWATAGLSRGHVGALAFAGLITLSVGGTRAQTPPPLEVPAKAVPVPTDVSPQMQKIIGLKRKKCLQRSPHFSTNTWASRTV